MNVVKAILHSLKSIDIEAVNKAVLVVIFFYVPVGLLLASILVVSLSSTLPLGNEGTSSSAAAVTVSHIVSDLNIGVPK